MIGLKAKCPFQCRRGTCQIDVPVQVFASHCGIHQSSSLTQETASANRTVEICAHSMKPCIDCAQLTMSSECRLHYTWEYETHAKASNKYYTFEFWTFSFDTCNQNQWVVHHNFDTLLLTHFGLARSQRSSWIKMKWWVIQPALSLLQSTAQGKAQKWMSEMKSTCGPSDLSLKQCFSSDMNEWQNDIDNWHGKVFFDRITKLQLKLYRSSLSVIYIVVCVSWFKCSILSFFQMMAQFDWMLGHWHC